MDKYKEMYFTLFNKITDIISELKAIQEKTEEMFTMQEEEKHSVRSLEGQVRKESELRAVQHITHNVVIMIIPAVRLKTKRPAHLMGYVLDSSFEKEPLGVNG